MLISAIQGSHRNLCDFESILNQAKRLYVMKEHQSYSPRYLTILRVKLSMEMIVFTEFTQIKFCQIH